MQNVAMRPLSRSEASRINGSKSRGPKTPEGKAISARNSINHGLYAKSLLLNQESDDKFKAFVSAFYHEFKPTTPAEQALVDVMAYARWRQARLWTVEQCALNTEMSKHDIASPCERAALAWMNLADRSQVLNAVHRHDTSYDRQFSRSLRRLHELRRERRSDNLIQNAERTRHLAENTPPATPGRGRLEPHTNPIEPEKGPQRTQNEPDPAAIQTEPPIL